MTDQQRSLQARAGMIRPKFNWGYSPDSPVQENPYPAGSGLHAHWDMTKAMHDVGTTVVRYAETTPVPPRHRATVIDRMRGWITKGERP